jgi:tetratricopeptide (TPR) repeat protein
LVPLPPTPIIDEFSLPADAGEPYEITIQGRGFGSVDNNDSGLMVDMNDDKLEPRLNSTRFIVDPDIPTFRPGWFIDHRSRVRLGAMNRIEVSNFKQQVSGNLLHFGRDFKVEITAARAIPPEDSGSNCAPKLDQTVATDIFEASRCLYTGPNPVQKGIAPNPFIDPNTIDRKRVAVLRGQVFTRDKTPLADVGIAVLNHSEYGSTQTQPDGKFAMVVNGGERLTLTYTKVADPPILPIQRSIQPPWRDYAWLPEAVMIPMGPVMTNVDPNATAIDLSSSGIQGVRSTVITEGGKDRQATLLVPQGTTAKQVLADGTEQALARFNVRATEYTIGETGPAAMPGELPPASGYTYAVDYTAEGLAAGATDVRFDRPIFHYIENFLSPLGFPVGTTVPIGYYDKRKAVWVPSLNGLVIKINSLTNDVPARAKIEIDKFGNPASDSALATLGFTDAERVKLAELYDVGDELWRVPITHFSPWDCNWPYGPPADAEAPNQSVPKDSSVDHPSCQDGSIIDCQNQALGESVEIGGTPFTLNYRSNRVPGRRTDYELQIPISGSTVPASLKSIQVEILIAGRKITSQFRPLPNQQTRFYWDGKDVLGRVMQGKQPITIRIGYDYQAVYQNPEPGEGISLAFAAFGVQVTGVRGRNDFTLWQEWKSSIGGWNAAAQKIGGWDLSVHHSYDPDGKTIHFGDGRTGSAAALNVKIIETVAGNGPGGSFQEGPATERSLGGAPTSVELGPDGSLYIGTDNFIRRVDPAGIIHNFAGGGSVATDGIAATLSLIAVNDFTIAPDGRIYVANGNYIRRIDIDNEHTISTFAGNPNDIPTFKDGPALSARFNDIRGLAAGPDNTLYVADFGNRRIRRITPDGVVTTIAGRGTDTGEGIPAANAQTIPFGPLAVRDGSIYFLESGKVIRQIGPDGIIKTIAGQGSSDADGISANTARLSPGFVSKLSFGPDGTMYIAATDSKTVGIGVMMAEASLAVTATATAEQRQLALASQAQVMGLKAGEIDQSIRTSLARSKDPFERGLLATYNKSVPEAIAELNKVVQDSPKGSTRKASAYFFLGQAYQAIGEYSKAIDAYRLNTASDVLSLSAMGLAFKLAGDESGAETVFYHALMSDSTAAMSKVQLMTNLGKIYDPQEQADKLTRFYATAESNLDREFFNLTTPEVRDKQHFVQGLNKSYQDQFVDELNAALKRSADVGDKRGQTGYLADLGSVYFWSNDYQKALDYYKNAERMATDSNNAAQVEIILGLAMSYKYQQQYEKAVEYFLKSLPLIKDSGNPQLEIFALQHLGESYLALKKVDDAKKYLEQAVAGIQLNLGADDPSLAAPRSGLARVYYEQGKFAETRQELSEVLAIRQKAIPNSVYVAASLIDLAELSRRQKTYDEAVKLYQQSLAILESTNKPEVRENVKSVTLRLASVYEEQNKLTEALDLYNRALALQTDNRQGPERALTLARVAKIYVQQQRNTEAQNLYQQAFEIIKNSDPKRTDLTDVLKEYANLLRVMHQENEAARVDAMVRARASSTTTTPGG